jgi:hypothetical protein
VDHGGHRGRRASRLPAPRIVVGSHDRVANTAIDGAMRDKYARPESRHATSEAVTPSAGKL